MQGENVNAVEPRVYRRPGEGTLTLSTVALERMLRHRQLGSRDREACGVLLGRFLVEGERVVIDEVTEPQPTDRRTRNTFTRSDAHQRLVEAAFEASGGTRVYAGEWHSHPEPHPSPSNRDVIGWAEKLLDARVVVDTLFFVIIGMRGMAVWEGCAIARSVVKLSRSIYGKPAVLPVPPKERIIHAATNQEADDLEA